MNRQLDVLIVSQMYPGADDPDLGVFVQQAEIALRNRGHRVRVVAVTRRGGGPRKHLAFAWRVLWAGVMMRPRPDVIWAHFLVPAGFWAALVSKLVRRPLIVTAHGRDVRNVAPRGVVRRMTRFVVRSASRVIIVSRYLRDELQGRMSLDGVATDVIDAGTDTQQRFVPMAQAEARARIAWPWHDQHTKEPSFIFVGTLDDRKNVLRLADAFARLGQGTLTFVGDGPHRAALAERPRVAVVGRVAHDRVATWISAADVLCLPSTVEPFGQVVVEAMACARSVVATRIGGPPEFVDEASGVLVDPFDIDDIEAGLRTAASMPTPNEHARAAAVAHDIATQTGRIEALMLAAIAERDR